MKKNRPLNGDIQGLEQEACAAKEEFQNYLKEILQIYAADNVDILVLIHHIFRSVYQPNEMPYRFVVQLLNNCLVVFCNNILGFFDESLLERERKSAPSVFYLLSKKKQINEFLQNLKEGENVPKPLFFSFLEKILLDDET